MRVERPNGIPRERDRFGQGCKSASTARQKKQSGNCWKTHRLTDWSRIAMSITSPCAQELPWSWQATAVVEETSHGIAVHEHVARR